MKITCSQPDLDDCLRLVGRCIASRPSHPILGNVLVAADAATSSLSLTGFDLNLGIRTTFPATIHTSGSITIPARLLSEIVSRLSTASPITLECPDGHEQIDLTSSSGSYQMRGLAADDFPELPIAQHGEPISIEVQALIQGIRSTIFSASNDEAKQILTGVHLAITPSGIECAATDGHRLAILRIDDALTDGKPFAVTIPARSLRELERLLSSRQSGQPVSIFSSNGQLIFLWDDQIVTSRSLDGTYPNYRQLIPKEFSRTIEIGRRALVAALERVAVLADQHNNIVKISTDAAIGQLHLRADAQDVGSGSEVVAAEFTGDDIEIAFNARYVIEGLKIMNGEHVILQCNGPTTPAVFEPVVAAGQPVLTYLVMPVQVKK